MLRYTIDRHILLQNTCRFSVSFLSVHVLISMFVPAVPSTCQILLFTLCLNRFGVYLKTKYGHKVCTYIVYICIVQTYDIYINHGVKMNEPYIDSLESYSDIAMILPLILVLKIHLNHTCNGSGKIGVNLRLSDHATPTHQAH